MNKFAVSFRILGLLVALTALVSGAGEAQVSGVTLPPGGDNQRSVVTQYMGLVSVTLDYNSPDVTGPAGEDRTGKIWGELVPYGMADLGFGNGKPSPWRVGANENTTFTVSHDVEVEGKPLPAGRYGLHMIPGETEWVVIFSKNSTSWGSFFYEESEDALRVTVKPEPAEFREWLTFDFEDRQLDSTRVALRWEKLRVPFEVSVPNQVDLYVATLRDELRGSPGFSWQNWNAAAAYLLQRDTAGKHLDQALEWAEASITAPFVGQENFQTLLTKMQVLERLGRTEDAAAVQATILDHPTATVVQIHQFGRQLITQGKNDEALAVFQHNARRFPDTWPVNVGLARGYQAVGDHARALEYARKAVAEAPDDLNRNNLQNMVQQLEAAAAGR